MTTPTHRSVPIERLRALEMLAQVAAEMYVDDACPHPGGSPMLHRKYGERIRTQLQMLDRYGEPIITPDMSEPEGEPETAE